jgi:hypothetical protein
MNTATNTETPRPFYRSEAFPEDVADLVESATMLAAQRRAPRSTLRVWLFGVLPVGVTLAAALALTQRLF